MLEFIRNSLSAKISIAVVCVIVGFISVLSVADVRNETENIMAIYKRNVRNIASTIQKGFISAMKEGRNDDVQKILEDIGTQEDIVAVRILDESGRILRSTKRGEIGGLTDKRTLQAYKSMDEEDGGEFMKGEMLSYLRPIYNGKDCFGCHPPSKKINGILEMDLSMTGAYQEVKRNRSFMVKWGLLAVLFVAFSEILLLRHLVTKPIRELSGAMSKAEKGEEFVLDIRYYDEIGKLGSSFKSMMGRISQLNKESTEKEKELVRRQEADKSRTRLESIINGMPDGVAIIDRNMTLVKTNPRHKEIFPDAKEGEKCYACIHKRDAVCPHCGVTKVFQDGQPHEHQSTVTLEGGQVRVVHSISAPIVEDGGEINHAVEVVRDITGRVLLEKEIKEKSWELERANKKLAKMAVTDGLTMLFNHRYFQDTLAKEFKRLARHRSLPFLSLLMIDLDNFKGLNDSYGHQAGDHVLRGIASIVNNSVRTTDVSARYGGEEFVVVMPETDPEGALVVAERIRKNVEDAVFTYRGEALKTTASIGMASYPSEGIRSEDDLLRAADAALYTAKVQGKNRVFVA